jgi:hypothetical protein
VYDTRTFTIQDRLHLPGLGNVKDMTSCKTRLCVYIADWSNCSIHRIENKRTFSQWFVHDVPCGLSVTAACNVLVTYRDIGRVKEYTTDGMFLREISLESDMLHPWHTVEFKEDLFFVCHGSDHDPLHRVCLVGPTGRTLASFGGYRGLGDDHLNVPIRLSVVNNSVLVSDLKNHRILAFDQSLKCMREVITGLRWPLRICYDAEMDWLCVADNLREKGKYVGGEVRVYSVLG